MEIKYRLNSEDSGFVDKLIDKGYPPNNPAVVHRNLPLYAIKTELPKNQIETGEKIEISFEWLKFNLEKGEYEKDEEKQDSFQVEAGGEQVEIAVGETLEFSSDEPGIYTIRTIDDNVGSAKAKVEVVESG